MQDGAVVLQDHDYQSGRPGVEGGISPEVTTIVRKFTPGVQDKNGYLIHGMANLESRKLSFRCLEAFRQFICRRVHIQGIDKPMSITGT